MMLVQEAMSKEEGGILHNREASVRMETSKGKSYMAPYTRFLFHTGMWTRRPQGDRLTKLFFPVMAVYVFFFLTTVFEAVHNWGDLDAMTETFDMTVIYAVTCHKCVSIMWREGDWKKLVRDMEDSFHRLEQRGNAQYSEVLRRSARTLGKLRVAWTTICGGTLVTLSFMPLVGNALRDTPHRDYNSTGLDEGTAFRSRLPYRTWTPYDDLTGPIYAVIYILHVFIALLQAVVVPGYDMFMIALITFTCAQLRILQEHLRNIREDSRRALEERYCEEANIEVILDRGVLRSWHDDVSSRQLDDEMNTRVRHCVQYHETLLKFADDLEELVNGVLLNQFICSGSIFCTTGFQLTMKHSGVLKLVTMAQLLLAAMFEMGMFCIFSNFLMDESANVGYAAYQSEWYHSSLRFRKSASIIMSRARRASFITFGKFAPLSLETFAGILQMSYSYFTLLNRMNE